MPTSMSFLKLTEWSKQYGGLYTLKLGPGTAAVITDRRIVKELDKRRQSILHRQLNGQIYNNE